MSSVTSNPFRETLDLLYRHYGTEFEPEPGMVQQMHLIQDLSVKEERLLIQELRRVPHLKVLSNGMEVLPFSLSYVIKHHLCKKQKPQRKDVDT